MRKPRAAGATTAAVIALLCALAGCSSGPSPRAWAVSVCDALRPWRADIGTLTNRAQNQMTAQTTPVQAKENLVRLFGGAQSATEAARLRVEQAGIPDVDSGETVAAGFLARLTDVRDAYGRARASIEGLATGRADAFYKGVAKVVEQLNEEYNRNAPDTTRIDSAELKRAFDEVPECH